MSTATTHRIGQAFVNTSTHFRFQHWVRHNLIKILESEQTSRSDEIEGEDVPHLLPHSPLDCTEAVDALLSMRRSEALDLLFGSTELLWKADSMRTSVFTELLVSTLPLGTSLDISSWMAIKGLQTTAKLSQSFHQMNDNWQEWRPNWVTLKQWNFDMTFCLFISE